MLHVVENEYLLCAIESVGAELRSIRNKATGEEYIWQMDKSVWAGSSPVLFPSIGKIREGRLVFQGKEYAMPKHGIVRNNPRLRYESTGSSSCAFHLESSEETLLQYPFKFSFSVEFTLSEKCLRMNYRIENRDSVPMHFSCGGHTAYACPLGEHRKLSDYLIEFPLPPKPEASILGASGLMSTQKRILEFKNNLLSLSDTLFNEDALIFPDIEIDWVRLRLRKEDKGIVVRFTAYPHLALWSKPAADFVCIEPWLGLPDMEDEPIGLSEKSSYKSIDAHTEFSIAIEIEVE